MSSVFYMFGAGISTIILVVLTFISQILKTKKKLPNAPGTTGWPVIGETLGFISNPKKFVLDKMAKHSSEVFITSLAGEKMAVFCGPMANKRVFSNEGKVFNLWAPASTAAVINQPSLNSETHPQKPSNEVYIKFLRAGSIQRYVPVVDEIVQQHLNTHWDSRDEVKVHELAKEYMITTCLRVLINYSYNSSLDEARKLGDPLMLALEGLFSVPVNLPGTAYNKAIRGSKLFLERIVDIIKQRKITLSNQNHQDNENDDCKDLMSKLIVYSAQNNQVLSDLDIAMNISGLTFAGFYPTSTTITFAIAYLAEHPQVYEMVLKEQEEIANSKKSGEPLSWVDIQKMQYSWNVICETMRLKPPIPGTFRTVITDFTYGGFKFLKGCKIFWTPYSTNTDPKYFDDPEKFDPSRFEKSVPAPYSYVPFGAGSHMCVGKDFVRIVTLVFLHHAVIRFKFKKVNPYEKIVFNPDPIPTQGLPVYLQARTK
ncbi:hypothetical protein KSS87_003721 [Heliosperma pusillum]|nr:hypothetical protein KSS87_003721 [Heliosperma pusillum]